MIWNIYLWSIKSQFYAKMLWRAIHIPKTITNNPLLPTAKANTSSSLFKFLQHFVRMTYFYFIDLFSTLISSLFRSQLTSSLSSFSSFSYFEISLLGVCYLLNFHRKNPGNTKTNGIPAIADAKSRTLLILSIKLAIKPNEHELITTIITCVLYYYTLLLIVVSLT